MQEEEHMFIYNDGVRGNIQRHVTFGDSVSKA
jgi:hypothetical protein